jgi:methylase of polypeptide subunit release factors
MMTCGDNTHDITTGDNLHHILELGTGMAGLAAIALRLRLKTTGNPLKERRTSITLTDCNPNGVKNNMVNQ